MKNCFHDVDHARDVWDSKERIMVVPSAEIWEEIGDWSGLSVRIRNLYNQSKLETLEIVKKSWLARVEKLTIISQSFSVNITPSISRNT